MSENKTEPVMDQIAAKLQELLGMAFNSGGGAGKKVKNLLNGVWLGHPLHPALTDVPVGSWMVSTIFDLISLGSEDSKLAPGADAALTLGILGAVGAAATGAADWSDTYGEERQTGLLHAMLNTGALTGNLLSLYLRKTGHRKTGVLLSTAAFGVANFSAYLGGEMVFEYGTMVNHNAWKHGPEDWTPVIEAVELSENTPHKAVAAGVDVLLVKQGEEVFALDNTCSHAGGPLNEGQLEGNSVICPWHGSRFGLKDGKVLDGPATYRAPSYAVRQRHGQIEVKINRVH